MLTYSVQPVRRFFVQTTNKGTRLDRLYLTYSVQPVRRFLVRTTNKGARLDRLYQLQVKADPELSRTVQETAVKSEHHDRNGSDSETSSDDDEDEEVRRWHERHTALH